MSPRTAWRGNIAGRVLALFASLVACTPGALAETQRRAPSMDQEEFETRTGVKVLVGQRLLDSGDWAPVDAQTQLGLDATYTPAGWPAGWCGSLLVAGGSGSDAGVDVTALAVELQGGGRKTWTPTPWLRPYAGGGVSVLALSYAIDGGPADGSDTLFGAGLWLGGGVSLRLRRAWTLGVDARWSQVRVEIQGRDRNAGGLQLSVAAGYQWTDG